MSRWLALARETLVPIAPLAPLAPFASAIEAIGTIGTAPCIEKGTVVDTQVARKVFDSPAKAFEVALSAAIDAGPLLDMPRVRWLAFVSDASQLVNDWSQSAAALGWKPADFFRHHPSHGWARIDGLGIAWLVNGGNVVAMDEQRAKIRYATGTIQTCYRIWD